MPARPLLIIELSMASSDHLVPSAVHGSVSQVVQLFDLEVRELLLRRQDVTERLRSLHAAVSALQKFAGHSPANTIEGQNRPGPMLESADSSDSTNIDRTKLRRACRIALLEADEPLSEQDIYTRIVRRESFSFVNTDLARPAILRELIAMSGAEVQYLVRGNTWWWQLISRESDSY